MRESCRNCSTLLHFYLGDNGVKYNLYGDYCLECVHDLHFGMTNFKDNRLVNIMRTEKIKNFFKRGGRIALDTTQIQITEQD